MRTDRIIPARFLRKPRKAEGYERFLFHDVRWELDGRENPEFVLNRPGFRGAQILVPAENFGCGSSREMAVWALQANGVRAVIAPDATTFSSRTTSRTGSSPWSSPRRASPTSAVSSTSARG